MVWDERLQEGIRVTNYISKTTTATNSWQAKKQL